MIKLVELALFLRRDAQGDYHDRIGFHVKSSRASGNANIYAPKWYYIHYNKNMQKPGYLTRIKLTVVMAIALSCLVTICGANQVDAKEAGWLLKQRHRIYGSVDLFVNNSGVKVVCKDSDYTFTCAAPSWDMVLFSDKRKLVFRRS